MVLAMASPRLPSKKITCQNLVLTSMPPKPTVGGPTNPTNQNNGVTNEDLHGPATDDLLMNGLLQDNSAFNFTTPTQQEAVHADQIRAILDTALAQQKNDILAAVRDQLSTISSTPFSTFKRKADQFSNDGLKKQFQPLEEAKLRLDAVRSTMAGVAEGGSSLLNKEEAAHVVKTLDEGISHIEKRMHFLEIAQVEGWDVAKCLEKNSLFLDLPEDKQKQLKRAKRMRRWRKGKRRARSSRIRGVSTIGEEVVVVGVLVSSSVGVFEVAMSPALAMHVVRLGIFLLIVLQKSHLLRMLAGR
jgi:hypothetical protein